MRHYIRASATKCPLPPARRAGSPKTLAKVELLVLDDWGLATLTQPVREDLLEILEDSHGCSSTIVTSQVPVAQWDTVIGNPTLADAILDRLVHNTHRIELKGESMRRVTARHTASAETLDANQPS